MTAADALRANIHARLDALQISISEAERRADIGKAVLSKFLADPGKAMALDVAERLAPALGTTLAELLGGGSSGGAGALRQIHPDQLVRSPLNPRKATALDAASIGDLARSIAEKGVLQNLIARPHSFNPETFEIVAGERRWRAACHGIEKGLLAPDFTLPVAVRPLTDDALVEIALVENIDRADMSPLETADAIAFLHAGARERGEDKAFTRRLAEATGRSDRWVRQQVQLARDLTPAAREKLAEGKISLEMAKELSQVPAAAQTHALKRIDTGHSSYRSAEDLQLALTRDLPRVSEALFDEAEYDGGFVTREKQRFFADAPQAERLQKAAIKARIAKLAETHAFVEQVSGYMWQNKFKEAAKDLKAEKGQKKPWGVVVERQGFGIKLHDRQLKRPQTAAGEQDHRGGPANYELRQKREAARLPMRRAIGELLDYAFGLDPMMALRVMAASMVLEAADHSCAENIRVVVLAENQLPDARHAAALAALGITAERPRGWHGLTKEEREAFDHEAHHAALAAWRDEVRPKILPAVLAASERTIIRIVAMTVEGNPENDYDVNDPLTPIDAELLKALNIEIPPPLRHELDGGDILDLASPPPDEPDDEDDEGGEDPLPECGVCGVTTEEDGSCSACIPRGEDEGGDADEPEDVDDAEVSA